MAQYESKVRQIPFSQAQVYHKIANLAHLRPTFERLKESQTQLSEDIQDFDVTEDTITVTIKGIQLGLRIIEKEEPKLIKFEADQSMVALNLWIQILPTSETESKIKVTIRVDIPLFLRPMIGNKLESAADMVADMLARIDYQ